MKNLFLVHSALMALALASVATANAADPEAPVDDSGIRFLLEGQSSYVMLSGRAVDPEEDDSYFTSAGVARLNIDLGSGLNLQGDLFGEYAWIADDSDDTHQSTLGGGLHAYMRGDSGALGVFGALADVDIAVTGLPSIENRTGGLVHTLGIEGLWFGEQSTLGVQLGYLDSSRSDDVDLIRDAVYVRGLARYYFDESTLVQVEAAYLDGEMDLANQDVDIISVGARLQHEMDFFPGGFSWPGKVYVAYRGDFADQADTAGPVDSHTILLGSTFTFGHSLRDNERHGAAFDLPAFARWNSIAAGALE